MSTLARICRYLRKLDRRVNLFLAPWVSPRKNYRDQWRPKNSSK